MHTVIDVTPLSALSFQLWYSTGLVNRLMYLIPPQHRPDLSVNRVSKPSRWLKASYWDPFWVYPGQSTVAHVDNNLPRRVCQT